MPQAGPCREPPAAFCLLPSSHVILTDAIHDGGDQKDDRVARAIRFFEECVLHRRSEPITLCSRRSSVIWFADIRANDARTESRI
jgi:hypothetical protein